MGSGWLRVKAQCRLAHVILRSMGKSWFGSRLNEVALNLVLHQAQFSSGMGDGLRSSFLKAMVLARADSLSLSPLAPMRLGVAARPTHNPISKGHSPSLSTYS